MKELIKENLNSKERWCNNNHITITRSDILKENNKMFIQVSIIDNRKDYITNTIIYGENSKEILEKYKTLKEKYLKGENK